MRLVQFPSGWPKNKVMRVGATHREHLVPISAKVTSELADAVSQLADAGDRTISREVARAIRAHVESSGVFTPRRSNPSAAHVRDPANIEGSRARAERRGQEQQ
jgi:hypothetical protein